MIYIHFEFMALPCFFHVSYFDEKFKNFVDLLSNKIHKTWCSTNIEETTVTVIFHFQVFRAIQFRLTSPET